MNGTRNDDGRSPGADPQVTAMLRTQYAAPQDDAFWTKQEQRIMQSLPQRLGKVVHELRPSWWSGFSELRTADLRTTGLVAATLALLAAGATFVRDQAANAQARELAAREVVESTQPLDDVMLTRVRPHLPADAPERYLHPLDY
ncbi:MAG TPA: hypothetical protein DGD08_15455 [Gemmatimonas aurantiaca]|uniref:Uncharacterized protein n=2 Tax=Gemmatimonas aurantiaca TaxID=173480 RepID=C1A5Q8_GEMAT|nr:hypothetical protein [Gemmatimonas aurantiaca]BAH37568.1 hypothetical protein GAU_0526 [Gemmatimonas aurantiaca T-27]HCT58600.1 hypothetical protein [Gemmatimonas aurantiaca]